MVVGAAVLLLVKTDFAEPFRFVDRSSGVPEAVNEWAATVYLGTQVANRILPEESVLGSRDAGVIGYFSRLPGMNLEGGGTAHTAIPHRSSRATGRHRSCRRVLGKDGAVFRIIGGEILAGVRGTGGDGRGPELCSDGDYCLVLDTTWGGTGFPTGDQHGL